MRKIALLFIPPFLLYAVVLVVIAIIKKIGSVVPSKFRTWLLLLIPVSMIMVYIKQEQELNAITDSWIYLVVKNKSSKTASLDKSTWVDFSGNQITFKEGSKETVIQYNNKYRTFKKRKILFIS